MEHPRILIGIVTFEGHKYVRPELVKFLRSLTYPNAEVIFVTNSGEEDKEDLERRRPLVQKEMRVVVDEPETRDPKAIVVSGRRRIREEFLASDAQYLFTLDDDLTGPEDALERLLEHGKDIACGWYLNVLKTKDGKPVVLPLVYGFKEGFYARQLRIAEVLRPRLLHVVMTGMGCCLLRRSVLERVEFSLDSERKASDDTMFFKSCNDAGFSVWCDTSVACWHLKYPPTDRRSRIYDPSRYRLQEDQDTTT